MVFGRKKTKPTSDQVALGGEDVVVPPLEIKTVGIPKDEAQGLTIAARQLPGYPIAIILLANAISARGDRILMDYSAQGGGCTLSRGWCLGNAPDPGSAYRRCRFGSLQEDVWPQPS